MVINRKVLSWSRLLHIYLSIALLIILVFFSLTGITLNHATSMTAQPRTEVQMLDSLPELPLDEAGRIAESPEFAAFLRREFGVRLALSTLSHEDDLVLVDYRAPGMTSFIEIDQALEEVYAETTDYGVVAMLNDLHKGRDVDVIWYWLIDASAVLLVLFSVAGFLLLLPNKRRFRRVAGYTAASLVVLSFGYYLGNL